MPTLDNSTFGTVASGGFSSAFTFTAPWSTGAFGFVCINTNGTISTVTVTGSGSPQSCTRVCGPVTDSGQNASIWAIANPPTGTVTISVTTTSNTFIAIEAISMLGVLQSVIMDATATLSTVGVTATISATTVADQCGALALWFNTSRAGTVTSGFTGAYHTSLYVDATHFLAVSTASADLPLGTLLSWTATGLNGTWLVCLVTFAPSSTAATPWYLQQFAMKPSAEARG